MTVGQATAKRIDEFLHDRGISLYKLAKDACISVSTLQNLYRNHTKSPTVGLIFKIVDALGVSVQEFFSSELFSAENLEVD
ncbi:MAG: helix-turn-helix transcriptional regulator [Clostridiales bacterium]|nr:helix-turn-helix transcriptional regulator [Clostridiales bacterium]